MQKEHSYKLNYHTLSQTSQQRTEDTALEVSRTAKQNHSNHEHTP